MARIVSVSTDARIALTDGWTLALSPPDACAGPAEAAALDDWIPAIVPGTVAAALEAAGRFSRAAPTPLTGVDVWYRVRPGVEGRFSLAFEGLATLAEVFVDAVPVLASRSMFVPAAVDVDLQATSEIAIVFRALGPALSAKGPRARWRPQMIPAQGLRLVRTSLLGHMPGWCPEIHPVGPYRPVTLTRRGPVAIRDLSVATRLEGRAGILDLSCVLEGADTVTLVCGDTAATGAVGPDGRLAMQLRLDPVRPWWPHTHGTPHLYPLALDAGPARIELGTVGFRTLAVDRGADGEGFALRVNGEPVFCRGAVWTTPDIVRLPGDRDAYAAFVDLAAEAGMTMLRIPGVGTYETAAFFDLCDERGVLVWQDFMFANFDYPAADAAFVAAAVAEAEALLGAVQAAPSLAVLCGGSEVYQQAAMFGLPPGAARSPLYETVLKGVAADRRPDVPYVPNAPCGGALPFVPGRGIAHYYGVGAYGRGLDDLRRANVRFAAECLAFSNVPAAATLEAHLPRPAVHHPAWKAAVPRDLAASWDFEDVRDSYLGLLYDIDPARLRREDPARYLDLSRRVTGAVMEAAFAEWRRPGSGCGGALVFTLMDLTPGAGWGVIDATGRPKPAWFALKRAFRPVQVALTDEGTNGLAIHLVNETDAALDTAVEIACLRDGAVPVVTRSAPVPLAPRESRTLDAFALIGAFFDVTYAYRFGPPAHDVTVVRLRDAATGTVLADAYHRPGGVAPVRTGPVTAAARLDLDGRPPRLLLSVDRHVEGLTVDAPGWRPSDDDFAWAPGAEKAIDLAPTGPDAGERPRGAVRIGTGATLVSF